MEQRQLNHRCEYRGDQSSAIRMIYWGHYLHITDGDAIPSTISDHFVLDLFPSFHTLLNQHLWTVGERLGTQFP